jgi:hypothetical protein
MENRKLRKYKKYREGEKEPKIALYMPTIRKKTARLLA